MKNVILACIDQLILFDSICEFDDYKEHLRSRKIRYSVENVEEYDNGKILVRIKKAYNKNELLY